MTKQLIILAGAFVLVVALLLVLSGCEGYETFTPRAIDLTRLATEYPDGPDKLTVQAIAVERYATSSAIEVQAAQAAANSTAVAAEQSAQGTAQAAQSAAQATAQVGIVQATQQAAAAELERQRQWATQQSANATQCAQATQQSLAVAATSQALAMQATAEQRSFEATATAAALNRSATSTAEARSYEATTTAQAKADIGTVTAQAWEGKTTATAESVQATAGAYAATMTRQAEKREEVLGYGRDYGIPLVLLILGAGMLAFIVYAVRLQAKRPIVYPRNVLGDAEPMACPVEGGGYTFVDLDRQPGPAITVLPSGHVAAPLLRSAGQEERTTARDQLVDGMSRPKLGAGAKSTAAPALPMPAPPEAPAPGLRSVRVLRRLDQAERAGFLPPPLVAALAADWEEEV